ncbi:MAG: hypothetical protein WBK28_02125 [Minisyncoccia bacterium]
MNEVCESIRSFIGPPVGAVAVGLFVGVPIGGALWILGSAGVLLAQFLGLIPG